MSEIILTTSARSRPSHLLAGLIETLGAWAMSQKEHIEKVAALTQGQHRYEVYQYTAGRFVCFLGLYDGNVTVIAGKQFMAMRRLLKKHGSFSSARLPEKRTFGRF